jgi:HK97 family phage prohead protease
MRRTTMAIKTDREYRNVELRAFELRDEEYIVEGYATTFDDPYLLLEFDGVKYFEKISRDAFSEADMSDVIFLYDHEGMVFARLSNNTLTLELDDKGLKVRADLSSTTQSREMFEAIKTGLVTKMSWAFTVREDAWDDVTNTRTILKVKKVYDVSAVSIPANPDTSISARSYVNGVIERREAERLQRQKKINKIKLKIKLGGNS